MLTENDEPSGNATYRFRLDLATPSVTRSFSNILFDSFSSLLLFVFESLETDKLDELIEITG